MNNKLFDNAHVDTSASKLLSAADWLALESDGRAISDEFANAVMVVENTQPALESLGDTIDRLEARIASDVAITAAEIQVEKRFADHILTHALNMPQHLSAPALESFDNLENAPDIALEDLKETIQKAVSAFWEWLKNMGNKIKKQFGKKGLFAVYLKKTIDGLKAAYNSLSQKIEGREYTINLPVKDVKELFEVTKKVNKFQSDVRKDLKTLTKMIKGMKKGKELKLPKAIKAEFSHDGWGKWSIGLTAEDEYKDEDALKIDSKEVKFKMGIIAAFKASLSTIDDEDKLGQDIVSAVLTMDEMEAELGDDTSDETKAAVKFAKNFGLGLLSLSKGNTKLTNALIKPYKAIATAVSAKKSKEDKTGDGEGGK